ncbi:MAG TPA: DUF664 domain-containing protein [Candidatus Limnocylindria bacterium]|nr:DUF664 domain-containing protein [Candidatus Limnocylindria bacterium]
MNADTRSILFPLEGYRSRETGLFVAQLDELTKLLIVDLEGALPEELAWQPAPGMNTVGMLLAHIAVVEVFWTQVGPLGMTSFATDDVLGIGIDDDGLPLPEGAAPPAGLAGKGLGFFIDLIGRGREYCKRATRPLTDTDLDREVSRTRRNGAQETANLRWIYHHLVEHLAGHYGQVNMLRHYYRVSRGVPDPQRR